MKFRCAKCLKEYAIDTSERIVHCPFCEHVTDLLTKSDRTTAEQAQTSWTTREYVEWLEGKPKKQW